MKGRHRRRLHVRVHDDENWRWLSACKICSGPDGGYHLDTCMTDDNHRRSDRRLRKAGLK